MHVLPSPSRQTTGVCLALLCMASLVGAAALVPDGPRIGGEGPGQDQGQGQGQNSLTPSIDTPTQPQGQASRPIDGGSGASNSGGPEFRSYSGSSTYEIRLSKPVVPGQPVTITVLKNGQPVDGVTVTVNGDPVGRTDQFGEVTTTVPFTESLNVSAERAATRGVTDATPTTGTVTHVETGPQLLFDRRAAPAQPTDTPVPPVRENESLETTIDLIPQRAPRPSESVTMVALVDGEPVAGATVRRNGTVVGETDAAGRITVAIPWTPATTIRATRGAASGSWNRSFAPLALSVRTGGQLPVAAGLPVSIAVTQAGRPVEQATVRVDADRTGETGAGGIVDGQLPRANRVTVTATRGAMTTTTELTGLYVPYVIGVVVLGSVLLTVVGGAVLRSQIVTGVTTVGGVVARIPRLLLHAIIAGAAVVGDVLAALRTQSPGAAVRIISDRLGRALTRLVERIRDGLSRGESAVGAGSSPADATAPGDDTGAPDSATAERLTVREAFQEVRHRVRGETRTLTPAEIRAAAVDQGLSPAEVQIIVDEFRDVTYGQDDPAAVIDAVTDAVDRLDGASTPQTEEAADRS